MPLTQINGIDMYYELQGQGHPLVLISGFTCDATLWDLHRDELTKHFTLLVFDNRGAGRSSSPDTPYTIEQMAEDTYQLFSQLGLKKPHIVGHSMGGAIAQMLGWRYANKIDKLVICNSFIHFTPLNQFVLETGLDLRKKGLSVEDLAQIILPWLVSNDFLANEQNIKAFIEGAVADPHPQSLVGQARQIEALLQFDSREWFQQISCPTLLIGSEFDLLCPFTDSLELNAGIPRSELVAIPRMGHLFPIEQPEEFNRLIIDFCSSAIV